MDRAFVKVTTRYFTTNFLWKDLALTADLNCLNMLFVIQWRNIKLWGPSLKKLTLTEVEFLHPQTLNPFALQCRNLTEIIIINPRWSPFAMNFWVMRWKSIKFMHHFYLVHKMPTTNTESTNPDFILSKICLFIFMFIRKT